jgi:capsular polysaccharide transport system permease protein
VPLAGQTTLGEVTAAAGNTTEVALPSPGGARDSVRGAQPGLSWEWARRLWSVLTFWNVVPIIGLMGFVYLYGFADSFYESISIVNLQNSSSMSSSLGALAGSSLLGSTGGSTESGEVMAYIESPEMLRILDKKFHLRDVYSSPSHSPFWRLAPNASNEDFLAYYQQMVTISQDSTSLLITINVLDWDAKRAQAINKAVLAASADFVNMLTQVMQQATIKYAKDQLAFAWHAVETAQPIDRPVAEAELSSAETAMASAESMASQQVVFLIPVSSATLPTDTAVPDALLDEAGILLVASVVFMILHLLASNVKDHRKI